MLNIFAALSTNAANMHIALSNSVLTITTAIDTAHTIRYDFRHCMANRLFTFSRVTVDSITVNEATSDNIGPFLISGRGWCGGNHLLPDGKSRSAKTVDVIIKADNTPLTSDTTLQAGRADIIVTNLLFDPLKPTDLFCRETIHYTVCGNSIQVNASHHFLNETPFTIDRYYGMQSMTIGETALRTPNGIYSQWTPIDSVSRFTKASSPKFRQFIEKTPRVFMAAFMTDKGLGNRTLVDNNDVVFIGNSWTKSYHKLIGNAVVRCGEETSWEGIYTWFVTPVTDNDSEISYLGYYNGKKCLFVGQVNTYDRILPTVF